MNITLETKIADLLASRPDMKDILIAINPKFKKLNNPILRRTLARIATVKQAAAVGGMEPIDLLNQIRTAVGEEPLAESPETTEKKEDEGKKPKWAKREVAASFDANALLDRDENPLAVLTKKLHQLKKGDVVMITADFRPEPLIDEFLKRGYKVYTEKNDSGYATFIKNR